MFLHVGLTVYSIMSFSLHVPSQLFLAVFLSASFICGFTLCTLRLQSREDVFTVTIAIHGFL